MTAMDEDERAQLRGQKVGFVFQSFNSSSTLTASSNVQVPLGASRRRAAPVERARELLDRVGLGDRLDHFRHERPAASSSASRSRVPSPIARILLPTNRPGISTATPVHESSICSSR